MRALVLAPHADDEALGAGGTICALKSNHLQVKVCVFYDRVVQHQRDFRYAQRTEREVENARKILAYDETRFFHLDEEKPFGSVFEAILPLEAVAEEYKPHIVIGPYAHDLNQEHRRVGEAMRVVFRPFRSPQLEQLMSYEIPGSTHLSMTQPFVPNLYVDVTGYEERKIKAAEAYRSEIRTGEHPRSRQALTALMRVRGAEAGVRSAEAMLLMFAKAR